MIDTCQLLNKARAFKYTTATVETLAQAIELSRQKAADRLRLFDWLVFNFLIGNGDNHLKNLSFLVNHEGVRLAPAYDLLCTAIYETPAFSDSPLWPRTQLATSLGTAHYFYEVNRDVMVQAARMIGLPTALAQRNIDTMLKHILPAADDLIRAIEDRTTLGATVSDPDQAKACWAGEMR